MMVFVAKQCKFLHKSALLLLELSNSGLHLLIVMRELVNDRTCVAVARVNINFEKH